MMEQYDLTEHIVELLRCREHIWTEEQQTDHRVCAWCNYCEGGCGAPSISSRSDSRYRAEASAAS